MPRSRSELGRGAESVVMRTNIGQLLSSTPNWSVKIEALTAGNAPRYPTPAPVDLRLTRYSQPLSQGPMYLWTERISLRGLRSLAASGKGAVWKHDHFGLSFVIAILCER